MVALSVSISAKISPSSTLSPTFFNHFATVPSSMVSLSRGMVTTSAIIIIYEIKMDNPFARIRYRKAVRLVENLILQQTSHTPQLDL